MEITFTAFNYGNAGRYVNGPGMCLVNLVSFLRKYTNIKVNVFVYMETLHPGANRLREGEKLREAIKRSDILHHWSGSTSNFKQAIRFANKLDKKVIIGPNVLDSVYLKQEIEFLKDINFNKILTVNARLKYILEDSHKIKSDLIEVFVVGPDIEVWSPVEEDNGKILWKGNSKQMVKDIDFGLNIAKKLPQYQFEFMGYPTPYRYDKHIEEAKKYHLYFTTSLSETMGLGLTEQWAAGIPSVTHPKIYLHGKNYETGIITNRDINSYCEAIIEIMENEFLHKRLSTGARNYMLSYFSGRRVAAIYEEDIIA